jgi:hypothetical protein
MAHNTHDTYAREPRLAPMPVMTLMEEAEDDLEDFERRYSGLMDVCDLVRSARLRLIARMKERES